MAFKGSISDQHEGCSGNEKIGTFPFSPPPFFYRVERNPVQVLPSTLPLNFGCAMCSTFLSRPSFFLPSCLQCLSPGFLSSYFRRTLTGSLSLCEAEVSPRSRISPTHTSTHTRPQEPRAHTDTHSRAHTPAVACPSPSRESRRASPPSPHTPASRARRALDNSAARNSDRSSQPPWWFSKHFFSSSFSFLLHRFRSGGPEEQGGCFPSQFWLACHPPSGI